MRDIDRLSKAIGERGYDDVQEDWDDYSLLLQSHEFKQLVILELYEAFFPAKRHEFELHLLTQLVGAVAASHAPSFLAGAAASGVVGNAVYDMLKTAVSYTKQAFKGVKRTHDAFEELEENLERIRAYMDSRNQVSTSQMSADLKIEMSKLSAILKLLGCRSRTRKEKFWSKPESW